MEFLLNALRRCQIPLTLCIVMVSCVWPAAAFADSRPRIAEYVHEFTSTTPRTPTGLRLRIDHVNPDDPDGKPPALIHELVRLHPGTVFDTSAVPRCAASDQELQVRGPDACPSDTFVGSGEIHLDTGLPGTARIAVNDVTLINAEKQLVVVLEGRDNPAVRFVVRGTVDRNRLEFDIPSAPGIDGPTPTFEVLRFDNRSALKDGRRVSYITTPPRCPRSGDWTNRFTFTFWDGISQTFKATSRCSGCRHRARKFANRPRTRRTPCTRRHDH